MNILAFNGSPRKNWNTATLLKHALDGAASQGAKTQLINLYDLTYKGCISCFACKLKGGKSYGQCAVNDGLTPILGAIKDADALIIGSPIFLGNVTGEIRSFLERLIFPYMAYDEAYSTLFPKKIPVGFIYTMGGDESRVKAMGYDKSNALIETITARFFGATASLVVTDTYQFDDYSRYVSSAFNPIEKAKRRKEEFPKDCERAFAFGVKLSKTKID